MIRLPVEDSLVETLFSVDSVSSIVDSIILVIHNIDINVVFLSVTLFLETH